MTWRAALERQRSLLDFALLALWRRRGKNLSLVLVYGLTVFAIASVVLLAGALRAEAAAVLAGGPDVVVQQLAAGRPALVEAEAVAPARGHPRRVARRRPPLGRLRRPGEPRHLHGAGAGGLRGTARRGGAGRRGGGGRALEARGEGRAAGRGRAVALPRRAPAARRGDRAGLHRPGAPGRRGLRRGSSRCRRTASPTWPSR